MGFLSSINQYLIYILVAVILALTGYNYVLRQENKTLTATVALNEAALERSKSLIARMTNSKEISDRVNNYIDNGIDFVLTEHKVISDELTLAFEDYLRDSKGLSDCDKVDESIMVPEKVEERVINGQATKTVYVDYSTLPNEKKLRQQIIDAAWKVYCIGNKTAEGCL